MKISITILKMSLFLFVAIYYYKGYSQNTLPYFGQTPPDSVPVRFGPAFLQTDNTWSWYSGPVFSPDGREMFFGKYHYIPSGNVKMYYIQDVNGVWTLPQIAPFSGTASLSSPNYSVDGNKLFFNADFSSVDLNKIYYVTKIANAWSTPVLINMPYLSLPEMISGTSMTLDSTFYFTLHTTQGAYIYRSKCINGQYTSFERLPNQINLYNSSSAYIDPEEEYLLFDSNRPGTLGESDLYICFKKPDGGWTSAQNLGTNINCASWDYNPSISTDGKYLFFQSKRTGDINANTYWVDASFIDELNPYSGINDRITINGVELLQNKPNPFSNNTEIKCFIPSNTASAMLMIFDMNGKHIKTFNISERGDCLVKINAADLKGAGMYIYSLYIVNKEISTKRMILSE